MTLRSTILCPYAGDAFGGSVVSSFILIERLLQQGWPVKIALHGEGRVADLARQKNFPLVQMPALSGTPESQRQDGWKLGNLTAIFDCYKVLKRQSVGLLHLNDKRMLRTWMFASILTKTKVLTHWRSVYKPSRSVDLGFWATDRIVCVSDYSRNKLPPSAKLKADVVYNPFIPAFDEAEAKQARSDIRKQLNIPEEAALIGQFGALTQRKRPHVLAKILQNLPRTQDDRPVYGLLCGERAEPYDTELDPYLNDPLLKPRLFHPGFVSNPEQWMAACDVMIAPAIDEPLARVGVEAQSTGVPVIVSSDGGLKEVVEHDASGFVLEPYNDPLWLDTIAAILNDRTLALKLSEGGRKAAAQLAPERHVEAMKTVYASLGFSA